MHTYVLVCVLSILSASVVEGSLEKKSGGNRTVELLIVSNIDCLTPKPKKFFLQSFLNFFSHPCPTCLQLAAEQIPENFCCCINTDRYIYVIYLLLEFIPSTFRIISTFSTANKESKVLMLSHEPSVFWECKAYY